MIIVLGNPGSANDLVAKALSLSPSVHHYKGAECELVQSVSSSAKLFMDDLPVSKPTNCATFEKYTLMISKQDDSI